MSGSASRVEQVEWISVGRPMPRIASVKPLHARVVRLTWRGADRAIDIDLAPALVAHRLFAGLREDDDLFATVKVNEDGNALEWADGAELSAVWIEELAEAAMTNVGFRAAMDEANLTLDSAAAHLGVSRRLIADYRKDKPIPKHIALATRYLHRIRTVGL